MYKRGLATILFLVTGFATAQTPEPKPAFPGQTDAPAPQRESRYKTEVITDKLVGPWAIAFLPDGNFLVTERRGSLRTVSPKGVVSEPIEGVPIATLPLLQHPRDVCREWRLGFHMSRAYDRDYLTLLS